KAYRTCGLNGTWEGRQGFQYNDTIGYTNYTPCFSDGILELLHLLKKRNDSVSIISTAAGTRKLEMIGLAVSIVSLIMSLFIFCHFRNLWNNRTKIHKNLFIAMGIQVVIRLTVYIDQYVSRAEGVHFSQVTGIDNTAYLCESFYVLLEYARTAMFLWMFVEGLYLHNMITVAVFQERLSQSFYYCIGWGAPIFLTVTWAVATWRKFHGIVCWWGYNFDPFFWILEGPRLTVIVLNLIFLLNIIRVLVTKLRESNSTEAQQVRKAVRAAIVLLPLLGITNSIQMIHSPVDKDPIQFAMWSYVAAFLTSFQGFFCALIYCFLNGEVQISIRRCWHARRQGEGPGYERRRSQPNNSINLDNMINKTVTVEGPLKACQESENFLNRNHDFRSDPLFEHWNEVDLDSHHQVDIEHIEIPAKYLDKSSSRNNQSITGNL
ncbi:unnamed protein product, partial [Allacma fusca]